jgi:Domain of unknown function (DUF4437)
MKLRSAFLALAAVGGLVSTSPSLAKDSKGTVITPAGDLKWEDVPGTPLKVAVLWGNPGKGAHGRLLKLPSGFEAGMHSHMADYHGVLVSGTWMHWEDEKTANVELTPGSYVMQVAKKDHNDKCKEGADCILFLTQNAKADYIPAKPAKK